MIATPFLIMYGPAIADFLSRLPLSRRIQDSLSSVSTLPDNLKPDSLADHMIVVGYGINGRMVIEAARKKGIRYIVIDMNPDTVRRERAKGVPIIIGDATYESILEYAGIARARVIVVATSDGAADRRIVYLAKTMNPDIHIITRTEFLGEAPHMSQLGADEVVPKELEAAVEITACAIRRFADSEKEVADIVSCIRCEAIEAQKKGLPPTT